MYHVHKGKIYGVLNDFDLSYQMRDDQPDPNQPSSNQRTGTLPFMAVDLLKDNPPVHGYRHDLESFMWVILFHIGQYQDGKSVGKSGPYYEWLLGNRDKMMNQKIVLIQSTEGHVAQPAFQPLLHWVADLSFMFAKASFAKTTHDFMSKRVGGTFDYKGGGGFITLEEVQIIFDKDVFAPITSPDPQASSSGTL